MEYSSSVSEELAEPLKRPSSEDRCSLVGFNDRLIVSQRRVNIDRCSRERLFGPRGNRESSCLYLPGAPHQSSATFPISSGTRRDATRRHISIFSMTLSRVTSFVSFLFPLFWETTKRPSILERRYVVLQLSTVFPPVFITHYRKSVRFFPLEIFDSRLTLPALSDHFLLLGC